MVNSSDISIDNFDIPAKSSGENDYFENSSDPGDILHESKNESDIKRMFIEGVLAQPKTLQDYLMEQLLLQPVSKRITSLGELLIQNLDENGFNIENPKLLAKELYSEKELKKTIELIRLLDPQGTCTDNFIESLLVQADMDKKKPEYTIEVIKDYFDLLEKGKYKEIAKNLGISENEVIGVFNYIKKLNPFPGKQFSTEQPLYVVPDLMIKIIDGELVIKLNEEEIPVLEIAPEFKELKKNSRCNTDKTTSQYVNLKIKEADWFIKILNLRNKTLLKTAKAIAVFQKDFFFNGPEFLAPLMLKNIAEEVGVHETTISRISNSKYVQTDWGIYPLKYFFSSALPKISSNENISKVSVKHIIKEII
jgi:RNA polymerase sigma-54 factor